MTTLTLNDTSIINRGSGDDGSLTYIVLIYTNEHLFCIPEVSTYPYVLGVYSIGIHRNWNTMFEILYKQS